MEKLTLTELLQCRKIGTVCQNIVAKYQCDASFLSEWLKSETLYLYYIDDICTTCQSATYMTADALNELHFAQAAEPVDPATAYYLGYITAYWMYLYKINPADIADKYQWQYVADDCDILHTYSNQAAIHEIQKEYMVD